MKAMVLAAGFGTRLRPLTSIRPKPLLPLMLQPMLAHILSALGRQGIRQVAMNLHHQAEQLDAWLGQAQQWGIHVHRSYEPEILGTAGGLKQAETFLHGAPFVALNADVLTDIDVPAVWQWHCQRQALVTMVVRADPAARQYGAVVLDAEDRVLHIHGRPGSQGALRGEETMFTGIQVIDPDILADVPPGRYASTTADLYPALIARTHRVYAYRHTGYWMDVGVPQRYLQVHWDLLDGVLREQWLSLLPSGASVVWADSTSRRDETQATIRPPVVLGAGVILQPGACIGPYAVLGAGCHIEPSAVVQHSVLWEDVRVSRGACLERCILGAGVRVPEHAVLRDVVRIA